MNEIAVLESFRADVSPTAEARAAARVRLERAIRLPTEVAMPASRPLLRRLSLRRRLALVGVAAVALGAGVLVGGISDRGPGVLERAQAALDPNGRILHVVVSITSADGTVRGESWVAADGSAGRSIEGTGPSTSECVSTGTGMRCLDRKRNVIDVYRFDHDAKGRGPELPQFRIDQPQSLSRALGSGYARLVGPTELDGRAVYEVLLAIPWIGADGNAKPTFLDGMSPTLYVDRETYFPIAHVFPDAGSRTTYETFEFLPADAENQKLLELQAAPDARVVVHPVGEGPQS